MLARRARTPKLVALTLLVVLATAANGCTRTDQKKVANRTLSLRLSDYKLQPTTALAKRGPLTVVARNEGALAHDVSISKNNVVYARSTTIDPRRTAALRVTLQPGTYRIFSSVSNDDNLGLYGFLVVS